MSVAQDQTFGDALRRFRVAAGLSQEALAERARLSARGISALERGINRAPRMDTVALLAEALRLSPEDRAALEAAAPRRRGPRSAPIAPLAPRTGHSGSRPLPAPPTKLIGREREEASVVALLGRDDVRLLTLTGPGGVGKTSLALQAAAAVGAEYRDEVTFAPLAAVGDPGHVATTIAQALGLREVGGQPLLDTLVDYLRPRRALLLLDNFEHVMDAAPLLAELRLACPDLTILVTSQCALRLRGEQEFAVPPLALPDPADPALLGAENELARYPAVQLFVQRARAVRPDLPLTGADIVTIVGICERLDGLPLAIELAASRVKMLPLPALLARLGRQLDVLTGGARDLPSRHQTMRATIAWSYDLLDDAEKTLFRRLAVFAGGGAMEAVAAVCAALDRPADSDDGSDDADAASESDIFDLLAALVDRSLLEQANPGEAEPRVRMLQTVREYGLELLRASGEAEAARRRHAAYFVAFAEEAAGALSGPAQSLWLALLEGEHDNLRAALRWAWESKEASVGLGLAAALWRFWYVRGYPGEGRDWLEKMLALDAAGDGAGPAGGTVTLSTRANALAGAGMLAYSQGDYERATTLFEQALDHYRAGPDPHLHGVATTLNYLASVARDQGNYRRATALYEEGLTLRRTLGDTRGIAASLNNLGLVARDRGEYERATRLHQESLALKRELGDGLGAAYSLNNLGVVAREQGDYEQARDLLDQALTALRELGDTRGIAAALNNLAVVARAGGEYARAEALCDESLALRRDLGDKWGMTYALNTLGDIARDQGDYGRATGLYRQSLDLLRQVRDALSAAMCLEGLAATSAAQGLPERGAWLYGAAAALRGAKDTPLPPADRVSHERALANIRAALDEEGFAAAWTREQTLSLDQAIAAALDEA